MAMDLTISPCQLLQLCSEAREAEQYMSFIIYLRMMIPFSHMPQYYTRLYHQRDFQHIGPLDLPLRVQHYSPPTQHCDRRCYPQRHLTPLLNQALFHHELQLYNQVIFPPKLLQGVQLLFQRSTRPLAPLCLLHRILPLLCQAAFQQMCHHLLRIYQQDPLLLHFPLPIVRHQFQQ